MLGELIDWVQVEHGQIVEDAGAETTVIRLFRSPPARSASLVWAVNDFLSADGGPPLTDRFAERPDLAPLTRDIAHGARRPSPGKKPTNKSWRRARDDVRTLQPT